MDAANACPPEEVGAAPGYAELLNTLAEPAHPEGEEIFDWIGGEFDPVAFDLARINRRLHRIKL